jgi:hypothetical protein
MSDTQQNPSSAITAVRAAMLDGLATFADFAAAVGKSSRTIQRLAAQKKLPIVKFGREPYVVVSRAREILMAELRTGHEPVRRGRPTKTAS